MEVIFVGSLCVVVDADEQDEILQTLLERFKCVPAFLPPELSDRFYHGFRKQFRWSLFHYMLPYDGTGNRFDRSLWESYVLANNLFSQLAIEVINPEDDLV